MVEYTSIGSLCHGGYGEPHPGAVAIRRTMSVFLAAGSLLLFLAALVLVFAGPQPRAGESRRKKGRACIDLVRGRDFFERIDRQD